MRSAARMGWWRAVNLIVWSLRWCGRAAILSDMEVGRIACTRIGGPPSFGRIWELLGIAEVLSALLAVA